MPHSQKHKQKASKGLLRWANWLLTAILVCCLSIEFERALNAADFVAADFVVADLTTASEAASLSTDKFQWNLPHWVPKPVVPDNNPMSAAKVELGRRLFYEPRLSVTGNFSCASCHIQALAFSDGQKTPLGATGQAHSLNSMSLTNVAYNSVQTWANPLMQHLEQQMLVPLFGEEPVELGMAGKENKLIQSLKEDPDYSARFEQVFKADQATGEAVSVRNISLAIAAFERSLVSFKSPYDRYRYEGDRNAISDSAKRGEALFNSERMECFHCHSGLNFSDSTRHERSGFTEVAFHNTGLYNLDAQGTYPLENTGVHEVTLDPNDMGRFRAPTLRNIALTAPYMHDGSITSLSEVIDHYAAGGRTIETGPHAGVGNNNPLKSSFIQGFSITPSEKQDLIAFLESLTDETFITNPALSNPHQ